MVLFFHCIQIWRPLLAEFNLSAHLRSISIHICIPQGFWGVMTACGVPLCATCFVHSFPIQTLFGCPTSYDKMSRLMQPSSHRHPHPHYPSRESTYRHGLEYVQVFCQWIYAHAVTPRPYSGALRETRSEILHKKCQCSASVWWG